MLQESYVYAINLSIGAILAALMTAHWRRAERDSSLAFWTLTAWVMTVADVLFAMRPVLPYAIGRLVPTLLITLAHGVLFLGAERTAGRARHVRTVGIVLAVHAAALVVFLVTPAIAPWRSVLNGLVWSGLSLAAFRLLRGTTGRLREVMAIPAIVFAAHAGFHGVRLTLGAALALRLTTVDPAWLQAMGDMEASFFMVALFVSLLAAHLQLRSEELRAARSDVQELSKLFPVCAWCRKVKAGDGYWQQIEAWLAEHREMKFTHSICESCEQERLAVPLERRR